MDRGDEGDRAAEAPDPGPFLDHEPPGEILDESVAEPEVEPLTPHEVVRRATRARMRREAAERDIVRLTLTWADAHVVHGPVRQEHSGPAGEREFPFPDGVSAGDTAADRASVRELGEREAFKEAEARADRASWRGLPLLRWDCAASLAAALGRTTTSGWCLLRQVLTLRERLPRVFGAWTDQGVTTHTACRIADEVAGQPDDVAAYVDCALGRLLQRGCGIGPTVAARLVQQALVELHAEELELERQEQLGRRFAQWADGDDGSVNLAGLVDYVIRGDYPDVKAFHDTLDALAAALALTDHESAGEPIDVRRAVAVGIIADPHQAAALLAIGQPGLSMDDDGGGAVPAAAGVSTGSTTGGPVRAESRTGAEPFIRLAAPTKPPGTIPFPPPTGRSHALLMHLHLAADVVASSFAAHRGGRETFLHPRGAVAVDASQRAWLEGMLHDWIGRGDVGLTVRPVVHCGGCDECESHHAEAQAHAKGYVPTDLDRERVALSTPHCVFPFCVRPAHRCDADHIVPWERDHPPGPDVGTQPGPTCATCNLAPLCRHHHRLKTLAGWDYHRLETGRFLWRSPERQTYLVARSGTRDVTDEPEFRELAEDEVDPLRGWRRTA